VADRGEREDTDRLLSALAARYGINIIGGFSVLSPSGTKGRNIARAYDRQGRTIASYTKARPFSLAGEDKYFEAGNAPVVFSVGGMPSSVFICYDLRFPELFRPVARRVKAVFVIANWPSSRVEHWTSLLRARAIENQCYVVGVNRTGTDGNGLSYPGVSCVFGPMGDLVLAGGEAEEILTAELDPAEVDRVRKEFPFLPERT
jgi:predicted amidohydrolase